MKVTFILKNLTESTLAEFQVMDPRAAFDKLHKWAFGDLRHLVSIKFGVSNAFRDRVDTNLLLKADCAISFKIEPRKGYKLVTFTLGKASGQ